MTKKKQGETNNNADQQTLNEIDRLIHDISYKIIDETGGDIIQRDNIRQVKNKQRNATNPRLPYSYKRQITSRSADITNIASPSIHYLNRNQTGCTACRRRLWDPI